MTKQIKNLDKNALGKIAYKNPTSEAIFTLVGTRQRARPEMDIRRMKAELLSEGFQVVPQEYLQTFKDMANLGIGELKEGKGQPPRWRWLFNQIEVAKVALANRPAEGVKHDPVIIKKAAAPKVAVETPKPAAVAVPLPTVQLVVAYLSDGRLARMEMPTNLTGGEARILADTLLRQAIGK